MKIGVLGGGDFWKHWGVEYQEMQIDTPYGLPADKICKGVIGGHEVFTLQRHGYMHHLAPHEVPWQANVYALGSFNINFFIHVTACGSLTNRFEVGEVVLFDQLLDFTKQRPTTFGPPVISGVTHLSSAEPISIKLINLAAKILNANNIKHAKYATMLTEEGPRFGTNAETNMFRLLGAEIINHSSAPEVFLAQELGLEVLGIALVTNIIKKKETCNDTETYGRISASINTNKYRVPEAVKCIISNLSNEAITKQAVNGFNVKDLDIRGNSGTVGSVNLTV